MTEPPPKSLIKERAAELDIDGIGMCDSEPLTETRLMFQAATDKGYLPPQFQPHPAKLLRLTMPSRHLKGARSVISAYEAYYTEDCARDPAARDVASGTIAMYTTRNHYEDLRRRLVKLAEFMEKEYRCKAKVLCCYVTLAEKPLARKAGLGFYGKHGIIVTPRHGSFVVLGEIITDLELEPDRQLEISCGLCEVCREACPTQAIGAPYFIDRNRCIQAYCGRRDTVPVWMRDLWAKRFYGCTTCQDVCPRNRKLTPSLRKVECGVVGTSVSMLDVLLISEADFAARFRDNQIGMRERNVIRRNAIIVAGNSQSETFIPHLADCCSDPDPMIRQHSFWALSKIMGMGARPMLEKAMDGECEASVRDEIKTLLD